MMILGFTGSLLCVGSPQTADFRNRASYLFANEKCPVYASMPSSTSEDVYVPNIILSNSIDAGIEPSAKQSSDNYNKYLRSFENNVKEKDVLSKPFKTLANRLCQIPTKEVLVQYNPVDEALDFQMVLTDGIEVPVSQFVNETDKMVDFTISHENRMLVCGEMTIDDFLIQLCDTIK